MLALHLCSLVLFAEQTFYFCLVLKSREPHVITSKVKRPDERLASSTCLHSTCRQEAAEVRDQTARLGQKEQAEATATPT